MLVERVLTSGSSSGIKSCPLPRALGGGKSDEVHDPITAGDCLKIEKRRYTVDTNTIVGYVLDFFSILGGSALATALVPARILGIANPVLQLLAANWGHATNAK